MANQYKIHKSLAGQEDILYGEGEVSQERSGGTYPISKVRSIYPVNSLAELEALDSDKFPKAALYENDGITYYVYNTDTSQYEVTASSSGSYVGELPPAILPRQGDRWTRCTDMKVFIWYVDVDGGQWVEDRPSYDIAGDGVLAFDTLDEAVNAANIFEGAALNLKERSAGNGGGAMWDVVLASSVTPNTYNIVQCVGVSNLALVLRKKFSEDRYFSDLTFINGYRVVINSDQQINVGQIIRVKNLSEQDELTSVVVAVSKANSETELLIRDFNLKSDVEYIIVNPEVSNKLSTNRKSSSALSKVGAGKANLVLLGDSITEGVGATSFGNAYSFNLATGFSNKMYSERGAVSYPAFYNMNNAIASGGITTTGAAIVDNTSSSSDVYIRLNPGQKINISSRNFARVDVAYSDANSCDISWYVNGSLLQTKTLNDTIWDNTGKTWLNTLNLDETSPNVEIRCQTGTVRIRSILFGSHIVAPVMHILGRSGRTFGNYTGQPILENIYKNIADQGDGYTTTTLINLGTNSIYNSSSSESVISYLQSLKALIDSCVSYDPFTSIVVGIPPRANELIYPAVQDFYVNYINAVKDYCLVNNYEIVDYSDSQVEQNLDDNLHPNNAGHLDYATIIGDRMGVQPSSSVYRWGEGFAKTITRTEIPIGTGWTGEILNGIPYVRSIDGIIRLTGVVIPSAGTTDLICSLPAGFRPLLTRRFVLEMGGEFIAVDVSPNGQVNIIANPNSTPYNRVILNSISFEIF